MWGATPYSCGEPVEGYSAICNTLNTATQWSAADRARTILETNFDGSYIVAGTELAPRSQADDRGTPGEPRQEDAHE